MSTRSMVAIRYKDGSCEGMWKHWDGNPDVMLPLLNDYGNFCSDKLAEELIQFGYCEAIYSPEQVERYDWIKLEDLTELSNGFFIRGGEGAPLQFDSVDECFSEDIEYLYVWVPGRHRWIVIDGEARF